MESNENIDEVNIKDTIDKKIDISIFKGDKLFNENTPFLINILSPETYNNNQNSNNIDFICVIDTSRSMYGNKITQVKESLKIIIDLMKAKDRIALITFNKKAEIIFNLLYLTEINKNTIKRKVDLIYTEPGTNILSGLTIAVDILKDLKKEKNEERISSVLLLSDGCDMVNTDIELVEKFKSLTKNQELTFTLHTFGYGINHDAKLMQKLASVRDGSFYFVEFSKKVSEYFACVLGGCFSAISKKTDLNVKLLNDNCKLIKVFGVEYLYEHELSDNFFKTTILQFIRGKEYSFVLEIKIDEEKVKKDEDLLKVDFTYDNNDQKPITVTEIYKYKYKLESLDAIRVNKEYIRSQTYYIIDEAMKLKEKGEIKKAKEKITEMRDWLKKNYKPGYKKFLFDILKSYDLFEDNHDKMELSYTLLRSEVMQNLHKKQGSNLMYINDMQKNLVLSASIENKNKSMDINKKNNNLMKSMVFKKGS